MEGVCWSYESNKDFRSLFELCANLAPLQWHRMIWNTRQFAATLLGRGSPKPNTRWNFWQKRESHTQKGKWIIEDTISFLKNMKERTVEKQLSARNHNAILMAKKNLSNYCRHKDNPSISQYFYIWTFHKNMNERNDERQLSANNHNTILMAKINLSNYSGYENNT